MLARLQPQSARGKLRTLVQFEHTSELRPSFSGEKLGGSARTTDRLKDVDRRQNGGSLPT